MLDFNPSTNGGKNFAQLAADLTKADLYRLTNEMVDAIQAILATPTDTDVTFVPLDPWSGACALTPWPIARDHAAGSRAQSALLARTAFYTIPIGKSLHDFPKDTKRVCANCTYPLLSAIQRMVEWYKGVNEDLFH